MEGFEFRLSFRKLPRGCDQDDPTITGADDDDDGKPCRGRSAIKACAPRSGRGIECVWLLLDFADFAEEIRAAAQGLPTQELRRLDEVLGGRAAELFEAFVASGRAEGVAGPWSSAARNNLAQDYSFALLGRREAQTVARALGERGIWRVVDPMAGTGLHARLLSEAGLEVDASDAQPGTAGLRRAPWASPVQAENVVSVGIR